jgi:hypothetical protein
MLTILCQKALGRDVKLTRADLEKPSYEEYWPNIEGLTFVTTPLNDLIHLSCCIDCDSILYWNILCYLEQIFTIELTDTNRVRFYLKKSIDI